MAETPHVKKATPKESVEGTKEQIKDALQTLTSIYNKIEDELDRATINNKTITTGEYHFVFIFSEVGREGGARRIEIYKRNGKKGEIQKITLENLHATNVMILTYKNVEGKNVDEVVGQVAVDKITKKLSIKNEPVVLLILKKFSKILETAYEKTKANKQSQITGF